MNNVKTTAGRTLKKSVRKHRRGGQALVEMSMCLLFVLIPIVLGILEFGLLARNNYILANASREAARVASLGRATSDIETRASNSAKPMSISFTTAETWKSVLLYSNNDGLTWIAWPGNVGAKNGAPVGSLIKVVVGAQHRSITRYFKFLEGRTINQATTMKREANG